MKNHSIALVGVFITLFLAIPGHLVRAEETTIDQEAENRANAAAEKRKKAMETAKKYGVTNADLSKMIDQGVGGIAQGQMNQINNNPFFNKSNEELKAMGLSDERIQAIRKGQAGSGELGQAINGVGQLSKDALNNPNDPTVKEYQKSNFKREVAEERKDQKLGNTDGKNAATSQGKLNQQKNQSDN